MTKVLIIEDNTDIRENVVEILNLSGYDVLDAEDGTKGVALATNNQPDLILCDIMMPGIDGYDVFEILNNQEETKTIPFIFITAKSERTDVRKGMEWAPMITSPNLSMLRNSLMQLKPDSKKNKSNKNFIANHLKTFMH